MLQEASGWTTALRTIVTFPPTNGQPIFVGGSHAGRAPSSWAFYLAAMRVAIITESFAPDSNGVANSVLRVAEHLTARGHEPLVIAPRPRRSLRRRAPELPYPVVRVPSLPLPGYGNVRLALPTANLGAILAAYQPDVVHLASPF